MIKLIATDIDGTLVEEGSSQLNPAYFKLIPKLKQQGIYFAAASGRQYESMLKLFRPIQDDILFIAENGAVIFCRRKELSVSIMDRALVRELIKDVRTLPGCEICLSGKKATYVESKDEAYLNMLIYDYKNKVITLDDVMEAPDDFIKLSIYHKQDAVKQAEPTFIPKWQDKFELVCAGQSWLDCMNPEVSKGAALEKIQHTLCISREETIVFGDNLNDIAMFQCAENSYAIGNAREEVKNAAKFIADTSSNHGVLKVLKTLIS